MTAPTPILLPAISVQCVRCEEWIEYRCKCRAIPAAALGLSRGTVETHSSRCKGLPARCPRCKSPKWLEAPRWERPDLRRA